MPHGQVAQSKSLVCIKNYTGCIKKRLSNFRVLCQVHSLIIYRNHSFTVGKTKIFAFESHHFCET